MAGLLATEEGECVRRALLAVGLDGWRQIWRTVRYILSNGRKHGSWTVKGQADPYSSGRWYFPWRERDVCCPLWRAPVVSSRSLGFIPWIDIDHVPGLAAEW